MILTTMMRRLSVMALLALAPLSVAAQQVVEVADPNTTLEGEVLGSYYVDYVFPATAGKTLLVMLLPNGSVNFNVLGPDTSAPPIYEPTDPLVENTLTIPEDGIYTVRVFLTGDDAAAEKIITYMIFLGHY